MGGGAALIDAQSQPDSAVTESAPLARRIASGDPTAFDELVARYQPRLTRTVHRLTGWGRHADVEDIVQEVFLAALNHARSFRGDASPSTWLTAIAVNKCRSHRRRLAVLWRRLVQSPAEDQAPASDELAQHETSARVRQAVQALPPRDREVIVLRYFENLPPAEVARMTGQSKNAVEVRLHRARARLAGALHDLVEEGGPR
jgi:RNA polymerase sigma-70 factor, ECF subfamily